MYTPQQIDRLLKLKELSKKKRIASIKEIAMEWGKAKQAVYAKYRSLTSVEVNNIVSLRKLGSLINVDELLHPVSVFYKKHASGRISMYIQLKK